MDKFKFIDLFCGIGGFHQAMADLGGECVYESPSIEKIREYCLSEVNSLWDEVKRFENPHRYYVDLSPKLWNIKQNLLLNRGQKS